MPLPDMTNVQRAARNVLAVTLSMLALAGCAGQEDLAAYPCPLVVAPREFSYMTKFDGQSQDLSDTLFEAKLDSVLPAANCIYRNDEGKRSIVYDIRLQFLAQRGPKEREGAAKFSYFVTITGVGGQRLAGEVFPTEVVFENNATQAIVVEEIQPTIPLNEGENGDYRRIYVGFALTSEEQAYNRKNPR
jgi:hypothetical protein